VNTVIGGDFEGFVRAASGWIPASDVLSGGKNNATSLSDDVVAHPDNVMAEFALAKPVPVHQFATRVRAAQELLQEAIAPATFHAVGSMEFSYDWLDSTPSSKEIGCEPDYDHNGNMYAYSPTDIGSSRFAGFHLHFDVNPAIPPELAVMLVDCTIGVASIATQIDTQQGKRRQFYGTAGRHRRKPYGIEYRTLSSNVLNHLDVLQGYLPPVAAALSSNGNDPLIALLNEHQLAVQCINEEDIALARTLIKEVDKHV